tara:strand:+ start:7788 stop:9035 length:1248 start_codon:yes stop_codon:yes gene_type:complete
MTNPISLKCDPSNREACSQKIEQTLKNGLWVELLPTSEKKIFVQNNQLPKGPGIIICSGGSTGGPSKCIHPYQNMNQSALATAEWLLKQGITPGKCQILNGLPINHVSGLMPWWRSKRWNAQHQWLNPVLMRSPLKLEKYCQSFFADKHKHLLTSLVPTQLKRLLDHPAGIKWLKAFSVIWIGGSNFPKQLAKTARNHRIRLAPCYGTTETMAMVSALSPDDFLQGKTDCGFPMTDVELRIGRDKALEIRTPRLAKSIYIDEQLQIIDNKDGWWKSGDSAELIKENDQIRVNIIGRTDTAIHSGGETIFPERLQERLLKGALSNQIPVESILLLGIANEEWGERLVALVRVNSACTASQSSKVFMNLQNLVKKWSPAEKPIKWYKCQQLSPNSLGKWELKKWRGWVKDQTAIIFR